MSQPATTLADPPVGSAAPSRPLEGLSLGVDGRPFSGPHTGYAMYLRALLPPLLAAGARVTLVSQQALTHRHPLLDLCRQVVVGTGNEGPMRWEQLTLRRHLAEADYDFYLAAGNRGLPLLYRGPVTLLLTILDLIPWKFPRLYLFKKPRFTFVYLVSLFIALFKARAIFTISEASKRDIARLAPGKPVEAIWIRLPESHPPMTAAPPVAGRYFVYVGGLDARKNNRLLLEAFAQFRSTGGTEGLVLVGRGYEPLLPLIDSLGLRENVRVTGYVDDATRTAYLAGAVALVYPSVYEGYGLPVAEALQVGVRVITGTGGSLPEIGGDAARYLDPITAEALAAAMHRVAAREPDAAFHEAARAQVARLSSEDIDRQVVAAFAGLAVSRRG